MLQEAPQGLPRALDVQRFSGAREQEIRALVAALKASRLGVKFGVAALPRHLRRRAGSHKPFHRHAFRPNAKLGGKRRKLNAADGGDEDTQGEGLAAAEQPGAAAARPFANRRMRRQPALLQQQHRESAAWTEARLSAPAGAEEAAAEGTEASRGSSSGLRRLETHVWHAKRLAMEERYGWLLPAGAAGQGRGSRSFVHVAKASALMHDASYLCPLLLSGSWSAVLGVLGALLDPAEAAGLEADWAAGGGSSAASNGGGSSVGWEQQVMLHHPGDHPLGAICPAQLLLCPAGSGSTDGSMDVEGASSGGGSMQACLWVHPAAAAEAHAALRAAAAAANSHASIQVLNVRRLELRGGAADTALAVALAGATASGIASPASCGHGRRRSSRHQQQRPQAAAPEAAQQAQQAEQQQDGLPPPPLPQPMVRLQDGEAVQLLLPDPRLCKPVALGTAAAGLLQPAGADEPQMLDLLRLQQALLPLSEAELSSRRQQLRRRMLQLEQPPGTASGGSSQAGQQARQQQQQDEVERRGYCLAVLVRHDPAEADGIPGWSLIVPAGWAPPFWLAAAYAGCKPAGQREWRWLHTLQGRRCFPWDHPDTAGHAALMAQQQLQRQVALAKRPKAKQMLAAPPGPPDWRDVLGGGSQQARRQAAVQPAAQPPEDAVQQAAEAPLQDQQTAEQQAVEEVAAPMEVDAAGGAVQQQLFVARSYATMAAALHSSSSGSWLGDAGGLPSSSGSPIATALQQGLLQWRPRVQGSSLAMQHTGAASVGGELGSKQPCCLLEAAVQPIKTGVAAEGAAICFIAGREGERHRTPVDVLSARQQRRRQREAEQQRVALHEAGGDAAEAAALGGAESAAAGGRAEAGQEAVYVIGYVLSEAPRGAPRRCGAQAAVAAGPAWRLRALQHGNTRRDGGAIEAFVRNPGSATLFPVRLRLLLEPQPPL